MFRASILPAVSFAIISVLHVGAVSAATVTVFGDEPAWIAAANSAGLPVEVFDTSAVTVQQADEVSATPGTNEPLGPTLTWQRANTGLSVDFQLQQINTPTDPDNIPWSLVFNDNEISSKHYDLVGIGDVDGRGGEDRDELENDDFNVTILGGADVYGIGLFVVKNRFEEGEALQVFGTDGSLMETITAGLPNSDTATFLGIMADEPIGRIFFDEAAGRDDIAVKNFRFAAVPEPSTIALLVCGLLAVALRRPRR